LEKLGRLDLSVNYVADIANARPGVCGCFALQGGGTEEAYYFRPKTALVVDVSVVHTSQVSGTNAGLGLATFLAGPRYAFRNSSRYTPYVQGQLGGVIGFDALFPGQSRTIATSAAWTLGGGLEMKYSHRISFRVLEASFLNTRLPNNATGTQNNLKLVTGIVLHLK
jgi:opacity protein-like surface antigen